jgi:hypothetical protein
MAANKKTTWSGVRSKRAEIFKQLLPYINTNNYDCVDRYWVFGASSVWEMFDDLTNPPIGGEDQSLGDALIELASDSKLHAGRVQVVGRASLNKAPAFKTDAVSSLSPEQHRILRETLEQLLRETRATNEQLRNPSKPDVEDEQDAALAEEMLGKLPKAVDRIVHLENLGIDRDRIPNEDVKRYFEEAHRCYLYGFHVACAVLCRAILASALESLCDQAGKIQAQTPRGDSYFKRLVEKASTTGLLMDDRPEWAIKIRDAGNDAIHNLPQFKERWRDKLDDILLNTRKVLLDLYTVSKPN